MATAPSRRLRLGLAAALALAAQTGGAQVLNGCPEGQAIQSSDASGHTVRCIPVGGQETSIVGRYAFTGTQSCLASSLGFNEADLTPKVPPVTVPPAPPVSNIVSQATTSTWGYRTFNEDGTGTVEIFGLVTNPPPFFYNSFGSGLTSTAPNEFGVRGPTGGVTTFHLTGTFNWRIEGDKLIVDDGGEPPTGTITSPGPRFGWITHARAVPPLVATLGKDLKVVSLVQQSPGVEFVVSQNPDNPAQIFETPRICTRERLLIKQ
jgi:hypothetical protein